MDIVGKLRKARQYGIIESVKRIYNRLRFNIRQFYYQNMPWQLNPPFYKNLIRLIFTPNSGRKRLLGIWDYHSLPWSVGDPLVFIEYLSILKQKHGYECVDICIVYDVDDPTGIRKISSNLTSENVQDYSLEFLPIFSTCPYLGTVYQFNSRERFYKFLKDSVADFDVFPRIGEHLGGTYNFANGEPHLGEISDYCKENGNIPYLRIGSRENAWARWFYSKVLPANKVAVSLSLKRTSHESIRNADAKVWLNFIDRCREEYPDVVFVVVGIREEVFEGLRERPNVIVAKDYGTSIVEDFALIRNSLMYMCTNSGINAIAVFSKLPYLIFQMPNINFIKYGVATGGKFGFQTENQKMFRINTGMTTDLLFSEFTNLYKSLNFYSWRKSLENGKFNKCSMPTAHGIGNIEVVAQANSKCEFSL